MTLSIENDIDTVEGCLFFACSYPEYLLGLPTMRKSVEAAEMELLEITESSVFYLRKKQCKCCLP